MYDKEYHTVFLDDHLTEVERYAALPLKGVVTLQQCKLLGKDPNCNDANIVEKLRKLGPKNRNIIATWELDDMFSATYAHISMCIKEDMKQTLCDLALRMALDKQVPLEDAVEKLIKLRQEDRLFYLRSDSTGAYVPVRWMPGSRGDLLKCIYGVLYSRARREKLDKWGRS